MFSKRTNLPRLLLQMMMYFLLYQIMHFVLLSILFIFCTAVNKKKSPKKQYIIPYKTFNFFHTVIVINDSKTYDISIFN